MFKKGSLNSAITKLLINLLKMVSLPVNRYFNAPFSKTYLLQGRTNMYRPRS